MDIHLKEKFDAAGGAFIFKVKNPEGFFRMLMIVILLIFIVYKISFLNLPFYWDEAWSYATAVFHLNEHGIFNPHPDLMRGHPLFFYVLSAIWMKIVGTTPVAVHILPLIVSCILLIMIWVFTRDFFGPAAALAAVIMFGLQSAFLAQSGMLLPEVLLSLLVVTSLYFWLKGKPVLFAVSATLLVMTKESGLVIILAIYITGLIEKYITGAPSPENSEKNKHNILHTTPLIRYLIYLIPVISFLIFMALNRIKWGWFLYPGHTGMISADPGLVIDKSKAFYSSMFLQNGRIYFIGAVLLTVILKIKMFKDHMIAGITYYFLSMTIAYGLFSALNFFTSRYQLTILPLFFITGNAIIFSASGPDKRDGNSKLPAAKDGNNFGRISKYAAVFFIIAILSGVFARNTFIKMRYESDISVYYRDTVELHREVVTYASEGGWYNKPVYTAFLMQYNLAHPQMGYLSPEHRPFESVSNLHGLQYELLVFCSNENDPVRDTVANNSNYILLKRFENHRAWAEIYKPAEQ